MEIHFEYRITADEYSAAQALYYRLSGGRKRVLNAMGWILAGVLFAIVAWNQRPIDYAQFLLAAIGARFVYAGFMHFLLPAKYFRRYYAASELADKTFTAELNDDGFGVAGPGCSWRVRWQEVRWKGENKLVFMLQSQGIVFIFGKQYLTSEQQEALRSLSGLGNRPK